MNDPEPRAASRSADLAAMVDPAVMEKLRAESMSQLVAMRAEKATVRPHASRTPAQAAARRKRRRAAGKSRARNRK